MINKIFKIIHNKYSKFFKLFFFLRYVFAIFLIAILLFLSIPKFFNYEKKQQIIRDYLINYYDLEINDYSLIKFKVFPLPNLFIQDINLKVKDKPIFFTTKNLSIFLNFKNIYNYKNFSARTILLNDNKIILDVDNTKAILDYFANLKYKVDVKKLSLDLKREKNPIIGVTKINYSNYGYQKNKITGEIFGKKFKTYLDENNKDLNFQVLNTGINASFDFDEMDKKNYSKGSSKINILNNYLKFKFLIINDELEITKANLRNKDLSISFDSLIKVSPFFEISSDIHINKVNKNLINNLSLEKILENKEILKKFNSKSKVSYKKKKFLASFIESHSSEFSLAYGRLFFFNKTYVSGGVINCKGNGLMSEEYPRLNFNCLFNIKNKKKFLKQFLSSKKISKDSIYLDINGSLNLLNKKINFEKISINDNLAKEEDLVFFKESFEKVLFDESFFDIFKMSKIKEFILEVI